MIHSFLGLGRGSKPSSVTQAAPHKPQCLQTGALPGCSLLFPSSPCHLQAFREVFKMQICKPRSTKQAGINFHYQEEEACGGNARFHGWLMGLRSPKEPQHPTQVFVWVLWGPKSPRGRWQPGMAETKLTPQIPLP